MKAGKTRKCPGNKKKCRVGYQWRYRNEKGTWKHISYREHQNRSRAAKRAHRRKRNYRYRSYGLPKMSDLLFPSSYSLSTYLFQVYKMEYEIVPVHFIPFVDYLSWLLEDMMLFIRYEIPQLYVSVQDLSTPVETRIRLVINELEPFQINKFIESNYFMKIISDHNNVYSGMTFPGYFTPNHLTTDVNKVILVGGGKYGGSYVKYHEGGN